MSDEKDEKKPGELLPVKDAAGNFLSMGADVLYTNVFSFISRGLRGKITGYDQGGVVVSIDPKDKNSPATPPRIRLTFDVQINFDPRFPVMLEVYRIINPEQDMIIDKLLAKEHTH